MLGALDRHPQLVHDVDPSTTTASFHSRLEGLVMLTAIALIASGTLPLFRPPTQKASCLAAKGALGLVSCGLGGP